MSPTGDFLKKHLGFFSVAAFCVETGLKQGFFSENEIAITTLKTYNYTQYYLYISTCIGIGCCKVANSLKQNAH